MTVPLLFVIYYMLLLPGRRRDIDVECNSSVHDDRLRDADKRCVNAYVCRPNVIVAVIP